MLIRKGEEGHAPQIFSFLSATIPLNPFQAMGTAELGFTWTTEILNSRYREDVRYGMASRVVELLGKHFPPEYPPLTPPDIKSDWIPPLLDFSLLRSRFYIDGVLQQHPRLAALRILSSSQYPVDFFPTILPVLASTLPPTNLQLRDLALRVFSVFKAGWFSPQIENIQSSDLNELVQAVGDPLQCLDPPLRYEQSVDPTNEDPMMATVVLMEFASSNLWQNHLRHSNFTSCEEIVSTEGGRRAALSCMFRTGTRSWPDFLHTPPKVIAAIRRLEELQCLNTAEVIIMWAWTVCVIDPADRIGWKLILDETRRFYHTHGFRRLVTLARHIIDTTVGYAYRRFIGTHHKKNPYRVGCIRRPVPVGLKLTAWNTGSITDLRVSQVCQLRRLYYLVGYDPTTWGETVTTEEVDGETRALSGHPITPTSFTTWACNHS